MLNRAMSCIGEKYPKNIKKAVDKARKMRYTKQARQERENIENFIVQKFESKINLI